jgi:holo-[acyl-carrier protein] synthase
MAKILAPEEWEACRSSSDPARFLAKRFAAKEALGKALGTGIRAPVLLPAIAVKHDALGKPEFGFIEPLAGWLAERKLHIHLSISDEAEHALAFVVIELSSE